MCIATADCIVMVAIVVVSVGVRTEVKENAGCVVGEANQTVSSYDWNLEANTVYQSQSLVSQAQSLEIEGEAQAASESASAEATEASQLLAELSSEPKSLDEAKRQIAALEQRLKDCCQFESAERNSWKKGSLVELHPKPLSSAPAEWYPAIVTWTTRSGEQLKLRYWPLANGPSQTIFLDRDDLRLETLPTNLAHLGKDQLAWKQVLDKAAADEKQRAKEAEQQRRDAAAYGATHSAINHPGLEVLGY